MFILHNNPQCSYKTFHEKSSLNMTVTIQNYESQVPPVYDIGPVALTIIWNLQSPLNDDDDCGYSTESDHTSDKIETLV